jgi:demethylmenaquinone methyltransferase/2-methoxy-6-polyprenyl-1,4-benzoquinol methylase
LKISPEERAWSTQIQSMFAGIAGRYDLMNRLMTLGQDRSWRKQVIQLARIPPDGRLLDLGAGTGDLGRDAIYHDPSVQVVAADFTLEMMRTGKMRAGSTSIQWSAADALHLPYADESFAAVVSGFLLRNVSNLQQCLEEQRRILRPGGWLVALDTTRPRPGWFSPLVNFHLHTVIPGLGGWITGDSQAYSYLPSSTEGFLSAEALSYRLLKAGFREISFQRFMFGTIAIHRGRK